MVVWKNWRTSKPGDPSPELRFDAVEYDAEIARAEADFSWEWPARTVARLVIGQLRSDPGLLGRWDCRIGWCTAWLKELDLVRLTFNHPAAPVTADTPHLQFGLVVEIGDRPPEHVAAEIVDQLRTSDPKDVAEMIGGSYGAAEALGLAERVPTRWRARD